MNGPDIGHGAAFVDAGTTASGSAGNTALE
jgi:hypothetical protein